LSSSSSGAPTKNPAGTGETGADKDLLSVSIAFSAFDDPNSIPAHVSNGQVCDMRLLRCARQANGTDANNSVAELEGVRVTIWKNIW